jgi:soluble lytic murein transglycosylase-like protein
MWWLIKNSFKLFFKLPWFMQLGVALLMPLLALNLAVSFFGNSVVSPISPFFLKEKFNALKMYARHRPMCFMIGHDDFAPLIEKAERENQLPSGILKALIEVESASKPHRISFAGAMGPAQLIQATANLMKVEDPFDPATSIDAGARYLAQCLKRTKELSLAVAAYNAGPNSVLNGKIPQNGETEFYVKKVMAKYEMFK